VSVTNSIFQNQRIDDVACSPTCRFSGKIQQWNCR